MSFLEISADDNNNKLRILEDLSRRENLRLDGIEE